MKYINVKIMRETECSLYTQVKDSRSDCSCIVVLLMSVLLYLVCLVHRERRRRSSAHSQVVTGVTDPTGGQSHLHNHKTALLDIL